MKKDFDGIIFDMDGVLVDVTRSYREAIRITASNFLCREVNKTEVDKIKSIVGMNNDWDATFALINNPAIPYDVVKKFFQQQYLGNKNIEGLIDNEPLLISKEILAKIKNKYGKLAVATGRPRNEAEYVIKKYSLGVLFDYIVAMEDVTLGKPSPDMLIKVIDVLKLKNTVYIGDSPSDIIAAEKAGIPSIYVGSQNIGTIRCFSVLEVIKYLL